MAVHHPAHSGGLGEAHLVAPDGGGGVAGHACGTAMEEVEEAPFRGDLSVLLTYFSGFVKVKQKMGGKFEINGRDIQCLSVPPLTPRGKSGIKKTEEKGVVL